MEREAFGRAIAEGLIVVAASGNESIPSAPKPVSFPAAYPGVISVGATPAPALRALSASTQVRSSSGHTSAIPSRAMRASLTPGDRAGALT